MVVQENRVGVSGWALHAGHRLVNVPLTLIEPDPMTIGSVQAKSITWPGGPPRSCCIPFR
jgi:hypothetical protein